MTSMSFAMNNISIAAKFRKIPRSAEIRSNSTAMSSLEVLPATPVSEASGLLPKWLTNALRRIDDLSEIPEGWDSYGGRVLQEEAGNRLSDLLYQLNSVIQSGPSISLTGDGGLVAEWGSSQSSLEIIANPASPVLVYYCDMMADREWEMPVSECDSLDKWLWTASSSV
jgi:hypothetical protein